MKPMVARLLAFAYNVQCAEDNVGVESQVEVDGIVLAYEECGAGDPVVFLHGFAACSYSWRRVSEALSDGFRCISFDLMGSGRSDKPTQESYTLNRHSELILGAVCELGLSGVTLAGHSLGGGVCLAALRALGQGQQLIKRLILVDSVCYMQPIPWYLSAMRLPLLPRLAMKVVPERLGYRLVGRRFYHPNNGMPRETIEEYARHLASRGGHEALIATAKEIIPRDIDDLHASYKQISLPTQIVWGADDQVIPPELGRRLAGDIPNASLETIETCGHCPQEERPEEVVTMVRRFLQGSN